MKILPMSLLFVLPLAAACSATDNTPLEPSRDSRISSLASAACDHYGDKSSGCPGYGAGQRYATEGDCKQEFEKNVSALWPDDQCNHNQISASGYAACEEKAKAYACTSGASSFFEAVAAIDQCKAAKVCTDPRQ